MVGEERGYLHSLSQFIQNADFFSFLANTLNVYIPDLTFNLFLTYIINSYKIYRSKKAGQLLFWIGINKTKSVTYQRVLPLLNFQCWSWSLFTDNRWYSWIRHADLVGCWWSSSKISSSTVVDLCFFCML